jgi:hypothetical protein
MVDKYVPKVGDKVRATLGENVLVGGVASTNGGDITIWPDSVRWSFTVRLSDGWHFEQIVSVPTKFGAVIRRADGMILQLSDPWVVASRWFTKTGDWFNDEEATAGGFTVLFDGVDE